MRRQLHGLVALCATLLGLGCSRPPEERPPTTVQLPAAVAEGRVTDEAPPAAASTQQPSYAGERVGCGSRPRTVLEGGAPQRLGPAVLRNLEALQHSALPQRWDGEQRPTVALLSLAESGGQASGDSGYGLGPSIETHLVNAYRVAVLDTADQPGPVDASNRESAAEIRADQVAKWGAQIGARYVVILDLCDSGATAPGADPVLVVQVLGTEAAAILFRAEAPVSSAPPAP